MIVRLIIPGQRHGHVEAEREWDTPAIPREGEVVVIDHDRFRVGEVRHTVQGNVAERVRVVLRWERLG
jgi:hypothetical protein